MNAMCTKHARHHNATFCNSGQLTCTVQATHVLLHPHHARRHDLHGRLRLHLLVNMLIISLALLTAPCIKCARTYRHQHAWSMKHRPSSVKGWSLHSHALGSTTYAHEPKPRQPPTAKQCVSHSLTASKRACRAWSSSSSSSAAGAATRCGFAFCIGKPRKHQHTISQRIPW